MSFEYKLRQVQVIILEYFDFDQIGQIQISSSFIDLWLKVSHFMHLCFLSVGLEQIKVLSSHFIVWIFINLNFKPKFIAHLPGIINVTYATVPGFLGLKNQTEVMLAEPGADYIAMVGSLLLGEGETSATINVTILEVSCNSIQQGNILDFDGCRF